MCGSCNNSYGYGGYGGGYTGAYGGYGGGCGGYGVGYGGGLCYSQCYPRYNQGCNPCGGYGYRGGYY